VGHERLEIDAGCSAYPEHDHAKDAQEEVYVVLRGSGTLDAGDEKIGVTTGMLVRVGPLQKRKFLPGPQGIVLLAIGGTPGQAYPAR
jgi:mannose-6-phosphate isomerase-like protein (cupin superfamily)